MSVHLSYRFYEYEMIEWQNEQTIQPPNVSRTK